VCSVYMFAGLFALNLREGWISNFLAVITMCVCFCFEFFWRLMRVKPPWPGFTFFGVRVWVDVSIVMCMLYAVSRVYSYRLLRFSEEVSNCIVFLSSKTFTVLLWHTRYGTDPFFYEILFRSSLVRKGGQAARMWACCVDAGIMYLVGAVVGAYRESVWDVTYCWACAVVGKCQRFLAWALELLNTQLVLTDCKLQ
jgi:hypothetical protein